MNDAADLVVRVTPAEGGDLEETVELAQRLRAELLDLDVELVEPLPDEAPRDGAKGLAAAAGALGVKLGTAGLKVVVARIRDWALRNGRTVEVTIDGDTLKVTAATPQQQEQLVNLWMARHAAP